MEIARGCCRLRGAMRRIEPEKLQRAVMVWITTLIMFVYPRQAFASWEPLVHRWWFLLFAPLVLAGCSLRVPLRDESVAGGCGTGKKGSVSEGHLRVSVAGADRDRRLAVVECHRTSDRGSGFCASMQCCGECGAGDSWWGRHLLDQARVEAQSFGDSFVS